jgi:hypothetical protein
MKMKRKRQTEGSIPLNINSKRSVKIYQINRLQLKNKSENFSSIKLFVFSTIKKKILFTKNKKFEILISIL